MTTASGSLPDPKNVVGGGKTPVSIKAQEHLPHPWTVEFSDAWSRNFMIPVLRDKFRGRFSVSAMHSRIDHNGRRLGARDVGKMGQMPEIPGQTLTLDHCDGTRGTVLVHDPLSDDKELLQTASDVLNRTTGIGGHEYRPHPDRVLELDRHEMKTLARTLVQLVEAKSAVCIKGRVPTMAEVDALPGDYLYDPFNTSHRKPKFEKDVEAWEAGLEKALA